MNNQPPENNMPQDNLEKTENVFEFVKKVCFNKIIFMNINWKKYFNIHISLIPESNEIRNYKILKKFCLSSFPPLDF